MSTKRTSLAKTQAERKPATEIKSAAELKPSEFVRRVYARVKGRLESEFEDFSRDSTIEEKRFMIEILNEHSNRCSWTGRPRGIGEHEVYLYSAIEREVSGNCCVVVPDDEIIPAVEDFINQLNLRPSVKKPSRPTNEDEIRERLATEFRNEIELFARDAGRPSLLLMKAILARWNEIARDPEAGKLPNVLAAAAEIELERLLARKAAEAATEAA